MKMYCANCGKKIQREPMKVIASRFCSEQCKKIFNARLAAEYKETWLICAHCGDPFIQTKFNQKYCSPNCRILAARARGKENRKVKTCDICGELFLTHKNNNAKTCDKCLHDNSLNTPPKPDAPPNRESNFNKISREADECGLSYGKYRVQLKMGKTFEELKAEYESRR